MINAQLLTGKGIDLKKHNSGSIKTLCPECIDTRKNKKDLSLSVDIDEGLYNCHHCGWSGRVFEKKVRNYVKPLPRLEKLGKKLLEYFEQTRGISNNTLLRLNVTEASEWMPQFEKDVNCACFNYYRGAELVNIKFRGPDKSFKLAKDAELIFYNLNAISGEDECVIVEGEIDCLTLHECGIYNVVSVPNGASKGNQKLEYLDNCWSDFEGKKKIVLAVDADAAGASLKDELARRLGKDKCFIVEYPEGCKDANEVLLKHGKQAVKDLIDQATEWPLEGIVMMDEMFPLITDYFENGYPKGAAARVPGFDELLTFAPGQLTMITGMPGSGKDEFSNLLMASLAKYEGWPWAIAGFEEPPAINATKLMEKFVNKSFDFRKDPSHRINQRDFEYSVAMVDKYFYYINMDEIDATMDAILAKAEDLVKKKGIRGLTINPWNCMEHKYENNETQYVSEALTKLISFLKRHNLHGFLMAHPTKMQKDRITKKYDVPTLYSISGSAHFFNKTHNGLTIHRDYSTNTVDVYVQKVKWSWLGNLGFCSFHYDGLTRQYQVMAPEHKVPNDLGPGAWKPVVLFDGDKEGN